MFGRPLISTEVAPVPAMNLHDVTGLVVAPVRKILRRALDALYENPEKAERMGGQASCAMSASSQEN